MKINNKLLTITLKNIYTSLELKKCDADPKWWHFLQSQTTLNTDLNLEKP